VIKALICCHSLCERLSGLSSSSAYFHRLALIQDLFTRLLPLPLPPYRSRADAAGSDAAADAECLYATAVIDYATQLQALRLLLELSKHYLASAKSVASNRALEGSHAVTMAAVVAVTDAVMRIPACDSTSVVTLVLNGTEHMARPKTKAFASPYNSMAMGHRAMQQSIARYQSQLGSFGFGAGASSSSAAGSAQGRGSVPTVEVIVSSSSGAAASSSSAASGSSTAATVAAPASESASVATAAAASSSAPAAAAAESSSGSAAASTSASPDAPAAAAPAMDAETAAKVAEAQRLLTEALASFAKAKADEKAQMSAAAASSVVAPLFHVSMQNGRGAELAEMSEKLLLTQPALAVARGQVLEYFSSQAEVAQKSIFNLPTKMNASLYIGKEGPLLSFVKSLCDLLGYDLNPDSEEKDASMDDQISFVEAATWYITHPKSPFQEHQPELFIYRDIVAIYKVSRGHRAHTALSAFHDALGLAACPDEL